MYVCIYSDVHVGLYYCNDTDVLLWFFDYWHLVNIDLSHMKWSQVRYVHPQYRDIRMTFQEKDVSILLI